MTEVVLEWGLNGARSLAERCSVVVVVDVLSFTTAVTVAVERDITVWPHTGGEAAHQLARQIGAHLAGNRGTHAEGPTLSPVSLLALEKGSRLVLPSPNGSTIAAALAGTGVTVVGVSLRNASAAAAWVADRSVAVVAAGERWEDGSLRPAVEDLWGAGAFLAALTDRQCSVEAWSALVAYENVGDLDLGLRECVSGRELIGRGFADDVAVAGRLNSSSVVPVLVDGWFVAG